jgi:hypothetical protein
MFPAPAVPPSPPAVAVDSCRHACIAPFHSPCPLPSIAARSAEFFYSLVRPKKPTRCASSNPAPLVRFSAGGADP